MKENKELNLAWNFVNNTNRNIFLTGKAGTGKTTFLHKLKMQSQKRMVIVAPTGVAAINAKGVTIHSFFQLPFGPILPDSDLKSSTGFNRKFSKTKINIIKSLDLLVIDEISMVRADLLDGIDKTLRRFKNRNLVFGGVQLLMIGDLQQLSPVIKEHEWRLLSSYYKNAFFFSSHAYNNSNALVIELKQIYRQDNPVFINILNEIRNNQLSQHSAQELNKRYLPNFEPKEDEGYISLTTHNNKARQTNLVELEKLDTKSRTYKAKIQGNFPEHSYPNKEELTLKEGAQVMFIKNDSSEEKRYFNGKIGKVVLLDKDEVIINCPDDDFNIVTKPEIWENIKYTVDSETKAISEDKIGSYTQMPLRLAWSITIHKSQGLTFEKAIIDAQGAFAHGQTYVALSRCKSLEGLVLKSKITPNQIISDGNVISFNRDAEANQPTDDILLHSQKIFQLDLISDIFNFYKFLYPIDRILDIYYKNRASIEGSIDSSLLAIKDSVTHLLKVSNTFKSQLKSIDSTSEIPESNSALQERFVKAISYFQEQTKSSIETSLKSLGFTTDNKTVEKDINKQLETLEELLTAKLLYFEGLQTGFNMHQFLELKAKSVFLGKEKPKKQRKAVVDGTTNVALFELLRELRNQIANREDLVHFQVFTQKSLYAMCETLPTTRQELKAIHGMGKTRITKYGKEILNVIINYCDENDIEVSDEPITIEVQEPNKRKSDTKKISLDLYKTGKSIEQIAMERELNVNTIFGHLATFIASGEIEITSLISKKHYTELKELIPTKTFDNLSDLKHQLDDKYSYGELRLVLQVLENV
ncbi:helix-turn-helix domain-containing protein [Winogradskyella bathintestinalis]|uniref:Helix-turn-helix domain-containing protein n=1 Tax=Winogradskyella bathintestinalis TaxID=3035208 RepID=A0ABT7ZY23_9FLAO|nr:helix-turn-helix domain-containing protein [Winogradskyella bathintestinalis]MDN3493906.1 helix-turn-helix domain-containing protein [Winogradskyella bathintestinalis]